MAYRFVSRQTERRDLEPDEQPARKRQATTHTSSAAEVAATVEIPLRMEEIPLAAMEEIPPQEIPTTPVWPQSSQEEAGLLRKFTARFPGVEEERAREFLWQHCWHLGDSIAAYESSLGGTGGAVAPGSLWGGSGGGSGSAARDGSKSTNGSGTGGGGGGWGGGGGTGGGGGGGAAGGGGRGGAGRDRQGAPPPMHYLPVVLCVSLGLLLVPPRESPTPWWYRSLCAIHFALKRVCPPPR